MAQDPLLEKEAFKVLKINSNLYMGWILFLLKQGVVAMMASGTAFVKAT